MLAGVVGLRDGQAAASRSQVLDLEGRKPTARTRWACRQAAQLPMQASTRECSAPYGIEPLQEAHASFLEPPSIRACAGQPSVQKAVAPPSTLSPAFIRRQRPLPAQGISLLRWWTCRASGSPASSRPPPTAASPTPPPWRFWGSTLGLETQHTNTERSGMQIIRWAPSFWPRWELA